MSEIIQHYTTGATISPCIYDGIEILSREYLVSDCKDHQAEHGVVEVLLDRSLIGRLMSHRGAHLLVEFDDQHEISSKPVVGISIFHTKDSCFPDEAEDLVTMMSAYRPLAWWFYVIIHRNRKSRDTRRRLVDRTFDIMDDEGCLWVVADYMIRPVICAAGRRMMEDIGFEDTGMEYGNGLKGLGNDVYRIMRRKVRLSCPGITIKGSGQ